ncbi:MAG: DUF4922 domain-containing protein [Tannerellaceae bacterium]|jgi:ATP adenylyltransferase/5',5'''-P-1,P-4-tetraphosphate phosphorylase II|nr:DUF4922 domain-containing protein [Tannerellaceae bacterium]
MTTNEWTDSKAALRLLTHQKAIWPLLKQNYAAYEQIAVKYLIAGKKCIAVQHNPARITSVTTDLEKRKAPSGCLICMDNLPAEQEVLPMGENMLLLCNPYPIFPQHFTIASRRHIAQSLSVSFLDLLHTAKSLSDYTIIYNAPESGASLPDHLHFQAITSSLMPIENESCEYSGRVIEEKGRAFLHTLIQANRSGFIIESTDATDALHLYYRLREALTSAQNTFVEPKMNVFCKYIPKQGWLIIFIPRKVHRPSFFYAEGEEKILVSPGAADIGGIIITPRKEDFDKISAEHVETIFNEICYDENEVLMICGKYFPC